MHPTAPTSSLPAFSATTLERVQIKTKSPKYHQGLKKCFRALQKILSHNTLPTPPRLSPPWQQTISLLALRKMRIYCRGKDMSMADIHLSQHSKKKKSCLPPTPVCLFCPLCITYTPSRSFFFSCKKTPGNRKLGKKNIGKTKITFLDKQYFHCSQ